jgi:hypothetical protein
LLSSRLGHQRLGGRERLGLEDDGVPGYAFYVHGLFLPIVASNVVPNRENLCRVAACLRLRTLAWPLLTRNPLYIRYWGLAWILYTGVRGRGLLRS